MEDLKRMSIVFWAATAGIVLCLGGTIYTAVERHRQAQAMDAQVGRIPVPMGITSPPQREAVKDPNAIPVPAR
jgi:hypothetical protein